MCADRQSNLLFENDNADSPTLLYIGSENSNDNMSLQDQSNSKTKRKLAPKRFRYEWLQEDVFSGWLEPMPGKPDRCYCSVCDSVLLAGHSELERHAAGRKHNMLVAQAVRRRDNDNSMDVALMMNNLDEHIGDDLQKGLLDNIEYDEYVEVASDGSVHKLPSGIVEKIKTARKSASLSDKNIRTLPTKRKLTVQPHTKQTTTKLNIPERIDAAKLLRVMKAEGTDDEYDDEEEEDDMEDTLPGSKQILQEMRAELTFTEKQLIQEKQKKATNREEANPFFRPTQEGLPSNVEEAYQNIAEKELEARLSLIEEKRRQQLNLYKLRFLEMEAKVNLAEAEVHRAKELHELKKTLLQSQIQKEQTESYSIGGQAKDDALL